MIATAEQYAAMLDAASAGQYALPSVNVTSSETLNGVMQGFAEAGADGIVQVSTGAGDYLSGSLVKDMALVSVSSGRVLGSRANGQNSPHAAFEDDRGADRRAPALFPQEVADRAFHARRACYPAALANGLVAAVLCPEAEARDLGVGLDAHHRRRVCPDQLPNLGGHDSKTAAGGAFGRDQSTNAADRRQLLRQPSGLRGGHWRQR